MKEVSPPNGPTPAALPPHEARRLAALHQSAVLDTAAEQAYDDLTTLASTLCGTPIALVSLVDADRQWFKSRIGLGAAETPRDLAFCAHVVLDPSQVMEVPDATRDPRFAGNPLVTGAPDIRFYAGAPILSAEGDALGTLCVIDRVPRQLNDQQRRALEALARTASELLRARRLNRVLAQSEDRFRALFQQTHAGIAMCDLDGRFITVNERYCQIVGRSAEALMSLRMADVTHPNDLARNGELLDRMRQSGEAYTLEMRYLRPDGTPVAVRNQTSCILDEQGQPQAAVSVVEDVSDQLRLAGRVRESEDRFQKMAQDAPVKMWVTDASGACVFINRCWCEYVGRPMDTQLGLGWTQAVHADDAAAAGAAFVAASDARSEYRKEYRLRRADGSYRWHVDSGSPRFGDDGEFLGYIGSVVDVHDEREARAALERLATQRGATLDGVMDCLPSGVIAVDMAGNRLVYNRAAAAMTGVDALEPDPEVWNRDFGVHAPDGQPLGPEAVPLYRALQGETVDDVELRLINRRRGIDTYIVAGSRPLTDAEGRQVGAVVVFTDISARRRSEQALASSEARFRLMTDASPQIMWIADERGDIQFVNGVGIHYFGRPLEQLRGQGWLESMHPDDLPVMAPAWAHSLATGVPVETQYRIRRHDGEYRWHMARGVAHLNSQGRAERWYGVSVDIEDLRRARAAAEAATEAKSQFLANMSHEIRTPMNGVIGMTSLLQATTLSAAQREYVSTIRISGEHLLAVINDILDFSKVEAGKLVLEHYTFSLRGCVEEALDLVAASAARKNLELVLDASRTLPKTVTGDAGRLRQVLVNLLSNAIKFTETGEVVVRVGVLESAAAEGRWRLGFSVQDSGIGIPADRMDRLFGVFSQVDASHTRTYGGSGLGLAICKRLVERMGGCISARSVAGQGSTFEFEIEVAAAPSEDTGAVVDFGGRRLLVVDDNATNRRVLRLMLESWGLGVTDVSTPAAAIAAAAADRFDAALLDFHMPEMTGVALARALRSNAHTRDLPLILLGSVSGEASDQEEALLFARMLKPVRQSTLFDQLAALFGQRPRPVRRREDTIGSRQAQDHPLRILVAEDNSVNQKVALRFLERLGYGADLVANGLEAVQAVERQTYDLVLMDVQMPEMDGFEATRRIRARPGAGPRIVAVTANALAGDEQRCREVGMDGYISKPIDLRELAAALADTPVIAAADAPATPVAAPAPVPADHRAEMRATLEETFGAEGARELVETLVSDLRVQSAELLAAQQAGDGPSIGRVIHTLKSTSGLMAAHELAQGFAAVEQRCRRGQALAAGADIAALLQRYRDLVDTLEAEFTMESRT